MSKQTQISQKQLDLVDDAATAVLLTTPKRAKALLYTCFLFCIVAITWSYFAKLDEITRGEGKVIPSKQFVITSYSIHYTKLYES